MVDGHLPRDGSAADYYKASSIDNAESNWQYVVNFMQAPAFSVESGPNVREARISGFLRTGLARRAA
jgi:hypothetical protein